MHRMTTEWLNTLPKYGIELPRGCYGEYLPEYFCCKKTCEHRPAKGGHCKEFTEIMTLPAELLPGFLISSVSNLRGMAIWRMDELTNGN